MTGRHGLDRLADMRADMQRTVSHLAEQFEIAAAEEFRRGATLTEIANAVGMSDEGVRKALQRQGCNTNRGATSKRQRAALALRLPQRRSDNQMARLALLFRATGDIVAEAHAFFSEEVNA